MDCPMSTAVLRARFRLALKLDDFTFGSFEDTAFASMRSFIRYIAALPLSSGPHGWQQSCLEIDVNLTTNEFLSTWISSPLGQTSIAALVKDHFCLKSIRRIAHSCLENPEICSNPSGLFAEVAVATGKDWVDLVAGPEIAIGISNILFQDMVTTLGARTLQSFFVEPARPNDFSFIDESCQSKCGIVLKSMSASTKFGTVTVNLSRYDEDVETDAVTAYEWNASLRPKDHDHAEARACGMVYTFQRRQGIAVGDRLDLMIAADGIADVDVLQVTAFLRQNVDADSLLIDSDLCFVWLWERRDNTPKGRGAELLAATLQLLQTRFKKVRTAVFNIKPLQFRDWEVSNELPGIALEKEAAVDSLMSYIEQLSPPKMKIRFANAAKVGNGDAAHLALAEEMARKNELDP